MPSIGEWFTKYYPTDSALFPVASVAYGLLTAGNEIIIAKSGFIVDVWNPITHKVLNYLSEEISERSFTYPLTPEKKPADMTLLEVAAFAILKQKNLDESVKSLETLKAIVKALKKELKTLIKLHQKKMHES